MGYTEFDGEDRRASAEMREQHELEHATERIIVQRQQLGMMIEVNRDFTAVTVTGPFGRVELDETQVGLAIMALENARDKLGR